MDRLMVGYRKDRKDVAVDCSFLATPSLSLTVVKAVLSPATKGYGASMYATVKPPVKNESWLLERHSSLTLALVLTRLFCL